MRNCSAHQNFQLLIVNAVNIGLVFSCSLETNIIVKGFEPSELMYNLKYQNMIGNDKSSLATEGGEGACN